MLNKKILPKILIITLILTSINLTFLSPKQTKATIESEPNILNISVQDNIQPYLTNPNQLNTGISPYSTSTMENNIPDTKINILSSQSIVKSENPVNGNYLLQLKSNYSKDYNIKINYTNNQNQTTDTKDITFYINTADIITIPFNLDSTSQENQLTINYTPTPPQNVLATTYQDNGQKTKLIWTTSTELDIINYKIYFQETTASSYSYLGQTSNSYYKTAHSWPNSSSTNTTNYTITAINENNQESFFSEIAINNDADNDGLLDAEEIEINTDLNSSDTDSDQLSDYEEYIIYNTDPLNMDSDNDTYYDYHEISSSSDPLDSNSIPMLEEVENNNQNIEEGQSSGGSLPPQISQKIELKEIVKENILPQVLGVKINSVVAT